MLRPADSADREAILALGVTEEAAWFGEPEVSPGEVGDWIDDEGGVGRGMVAVDDTGRVRGFVSPGERGCVFVADPAQTDSLADEMLPWLLRQRPAVALLTFASDTARVMAFERHGLRHLRSSFSLARPNSAGPLPRAECPAGVEVARYEWGRADESVHRLIYVDADWASVPGHTERDLEAWLGKERSCHSVFLASRDRRPVGWVAGRILERGRGYIATVAVARPERGQGLGRALLLYGFADLQSVGAREIALDVEASNAAALGLYRSVGLEIEREWRTYGSC